ncbi:hypothetical protein Bcp1_015 [Bacillus phage Bcp1]|uniref:Putative membrane protein n=1 Tax=Bacillus phage Bcp1 TaxID=584892 RepID=X2JMM4_9CAUD|nr:hypothetical protein Bcp1_015 [Bacillus phage Bcp1]AHN66492.1 putative membrane protein [Bacillus phage Bcp1]
MVVDLPILGFMIGFIILVTGSISYCIGHSHGVDWILDEWEKKRRRDW